MKKFYFLTLALICAFVANAAVEIRGVFNGWAANVDVLTETSTGVWEITKDASYFNNNEAKIVIDDIWCGGNNITAGETKALSYNSGNNFKISGLDAYGKATIKVTDKGNNNYDITVIGSGSFVNIEGGTVLYLKPNANWKAENARFAAYFYNQSSNAWASMTYVVNDTYSVFAPEGSWTNVIFVRMNPASTENNWNDGVKWNQTSDLKYDGTNNLYTVAEGAWDKGDGTWSIASDVVTAIEEVGVDAGAAVYYNLQGVKVANPENGIFIKKQGNKTIKVVL